jgi:hypothetical protein
MIITPPTPRLALWQKIARALGCPEAMGFDDGHLPIMQVIDTVTQPIEQIAEARARAIAWAWRGKGNNDKVVRLCLISPAGVLLPDAEAAKLCLVDRRRVNELRGELWSVLVVP